MLRRNLDLELDVDFLQFGLIIVTIVLLTIVVFQRLARMEAYLRDLHGIQTLNTRLKALVDAFEQIGTKRLEEQLSDITDLLDRNLAGQSSRSEVQIVPQASEAKLPSGSTALDVVEAKLYMLGYQRVVVLTDLSNIKSDEQVRVAVEAFKDGAGYKGSLVLQGRSVVELDLTPVYSSFP
ncbi:MAG: hypothetical protein CSA62_06090 [Planctomycetota bacterium]|nr:MAG: hypothetical protein CSA62_06090 [Planctomycetota bacterium]